MRSSVATDLSRWRENERVCTLLREGANCEVFRLERAVRALRAQFLSLTSPSTNGYK